MTSDQFAQTIKTKYPQYANVNNTTLVTSILKKYPQYQNSIKQVPTDQTDAAKAGIDQVTQGFKETQQGASSTQIGSGLEKLGRGTLDELAGGIATVFSPVTQALKIGSSLPGVKQAVQALKTHVIDPSSNAISNYKPLQEFMTQNPHADEVAANLLTIGATLAGSEKAPEIADATSTAVDTVAKAPGKAFRSIVPTPPDVGEIISNPEDAEAMKSSITKSQSLAKDLQKNPRALSPKQNTANELFGDEGTVYKAVNQSVKDAGTKMGEALANPKVGGAPIKTEDISESLDKFSSLDKKGIKGLTASQKNDLVNFRDSVSDLKYLAKGGKLTIKELDDFTREWQPLTSKYKDTPLAKPVNSTVHDINELTKTFADKAETESGVQGHPYRESNDEYKRFIESKQAIEEGRGTRNSQTGRYSDATSLLEGVSSDKGPMKELFDAIDEQVGKTTKSGGMTFTQKAGLDNFIQDIYRGEKFSTALERLPSFGFGPTSAIYRILRGVGVSATKNPDIIIKKLLDTIESSQK